MRPRRRAKARRWPKYARSWNTRRPSTAAWRSRIAEHERERDRLIATYREVLAAAETSKGEALAGPRAAGTRIAEPGPIWRPVSPSTSESGDCLIATYREALAEAETSKGEALAELRAQLEHASAEQSRLTSALPSANANG